MHARRAQERRARKASRDVSLSGRVEGGWRIGFNEGGLELVDSASLKELMTVGSCMR